MRLVVASGLGQIVAFLNFINDDCYLTTKLKNNIKQFIYAENQHNM